MKYDKIKKNKGEQMTLSNTREKHFVSWNNKTTKNSLIELYRFLFAMWVVWYHSFFVFKNQYFNHGYIAVEFFFILSGFFLIKSIDKHNHKSIFKGLGNFLWKRIKSLGLPFFIGLPFVFWFMFLEGQISLLGYLWYIPFMLLSFAIIYIIKKLIKNKKVFILIILFFVVLSYLLLYLPVLEGWGLFRGLGGVSFGVLISYIPKVNLKTKFINFNWVATGILFGIILYLSYLPKQNLISEYFLVLLLIPMLIYLTNTLNVNCKFLNFLGSLSFGLYAYQCILRVLEFYVPLAQYWLFLILIALVLIDKIIIKIYKRFRNKKLFVQTS